MPEEPSAAEGVADSDSATSGASDAARVARARRRAEVALSAAAGDEAAVRHAARDADAAVRAGALGALVRMGRSRPADGAAACRDPDPLVRRAACELAPHLPGADYLSLLADADPAVVEAAGFALGEAGGSAAVRALCEVAEQHEDPLCRESAVAALGAIGDEAGLTAVLGALGGPPALRRRAVVALAAFEGEAVEEALRRATTDRDWQVRQAATAVIGAGEPGEPGGPEPGGPEQGGPKQAVPEHAGPEQGGPEHAGPERGDS